jgi:hypothetical protein
MRRKRKGAGIKDRLNFLLWLVEHGEEADKALLKSELTLGESVYAHDHLLTPQNRILTIRNEEGKRYRYEGVCFIESTPLAGDVSMGKADT